MQHLNDAQLHDKTQDYLKVIRDEMKINYSVQAFKLFQDQEKQSKAWPCIQKELETNADIQRTYTDLHDKERNKDCINIDLKHIKLCMSLYVQIRFQKSLNQDDLSSLLQYLRYTNHKIVALDMSSTQFKESHVMKVIQILNEYDINNYKIDVINFGTRKFYEK